MPTPIGIVFFCLGAFCFFFKQEKLLALLIIASIFEAGSAFNIAQRGIQPYYIVAIFIILRAVANWLGSDQIRAVQRNWKVWLLVFGFASIASAFILPLAFAGTPVYDPKISIDDPFFTLMPLSLNTNNFAQSGFLACSIAMVLSVPLIRLSSRSTMRAYVFAFYLLVLFIFAQSLCQIAGITFPDSLIRNNPTYGMFDLENSFVIRKPGSFAEPSFAGAVLALFCVGFIAQYLAGKGKARHAIISLLATGVVASTGSVVAILLALVALLARYSPFRFPWYINIPRIKRGAWIVSLLIGPLLLLVLASSSYQESIALLTVSKGQTMSFANRIASDIYALQLLSRTSLMGVGLGSNRASSMLTTLLSNVGIVGVMLFIGFFVKLLSRLPGEFEWLKWGAGAMLVNMCINVGDVTFPSLWVAIALAVQFDFGANRGAKMPAQGVSVAVP